MTAELPKPACRVPFVSYEKPEQITWHPEIYDQAARGEISLKELEWDYFVSKFGSDFTEQVSGK